MRKLLTTVGAVVALFLVATPGADAAQEVGDRCVAKRRSRGRLLIVGLDGGGTKTVGPEAATLFRLKLGRTVLRLRLDGRRR